MNPTTERKLLPVEFRGFVTFSTGHATDQAGTVYLSLIGRVTAVTAVWAAFHSDYSLADGMIRKRAKLDGAKYHTIKSRLPDSGWAHWIMIHTQATEQNLNDHAFYIVTDDDSLPLDAFWSRWSKALPIPAKAEWAEVMWEAGLAAGLITEIDSLACVCWRVLADGDKWAIIITNLAKGEQCLIDATMPARNVQVPPSLVPSATTH